MLIRTFEEHGLPPTFKGNKREHVFITNLVAFCTWHLVNDWHNILSSPSFNCHSQQTEEDDGTLPGHAAVRENMRALEEVEG